MHIDAETDVFIFGRTRFLKRQFVFDRRSGKRLWPNLRQKVRLQLLMDELTARPNLSDECRATVLLYVLERFGATVSMPKTPEASMFMSPPPKEYIDNAIFSYDLVSDGSPYAEEFLSHYLNSDSRFDR